MEFNSVPVKLKLMPPAGMVILGVTEVNVGSFLKVNSTPVPVTFALSMCTMTEPVEGRDEVLLV